MGLVSVYAQKPQAYFELSRSMPQCIYGDTRRLTMGTNTPETSSVPTNKSEV